MQVYKNSNEYCHTSDQKKHFILNCTFIAHRTYTGMIYLDYAQNNSILNVFCYLLLEEIRRKKQGKNGNTVVEEPSGCCQKLLQSRGSTFEFEELKRIREITYFFRTKVN